MSSPLSSIPCRSAYLDEELLKTTVDLCEKYKLTRFVETGSYHGGSSKILSQYIRNIDTIENDPELYKIAKENLKGLSNVKLHFGSSQEVLKDILTEGQQETFFFLDAHWDIYWPLLDELKVIAEKKIKPVIAIHDFFVPPDGKFGYDVHPEDKTVLDFDYIKESIETIYDGKYEYFYNSECSDINSGVIFIYPKTTNIIVGNCAGTFSGILNYLSWLCVEEIQQNNISVNLHWANKTDFYGNTFYNYGVANKDQVYEPLIQRENLIDKLFDFRENNFPNDYEFYVECPPSAADLINYCPDFIMNCGGGWNVKLYEDNKFLPIIRREYHKQWNKLKLSKDFHNELDQEVEKIKDKKVLAVMIRCSEHYLDGELIINNLINEVEKEIDKYDNILILTQVKDFFDQFIQYFGNKCIFPNRDRIEGNIDWKGGRGVCMSSDEYYKEIKECMIDVFLASKSSHIMSGASNMFLGALTLNPDISFTIFDSLKDCYGA